MKVFSTIARAAAVAAVAGAMSTTAFAVDFTVDETPYGGGLVTADKINGAYAEMLSFDGMGGFVTAAHATFGLYVLDGNTQGAQLNATYSVYAEFYSTGTANDLGGGLTGFTGNNGSFNLYLDVNNDTTKTLGATGNDAITFGNDGDDFMLASASNLTSGTGVLVAGVGGFFDLIFDDFTLTLDGVDYFIDPSPFSLVVNVDGDFDGFTPAGNQFIEGDVSAVFLEVPEPTSLALVGLALAGLGFAGSRRKSA